MFEVDNRSVVPPIKTHRRIEKLEVFQQNKKRLYAFFSQGFNGNLSKGIVLSEFCDTAAQRFGNHQIRQLESDLSQKDLSDCEWIENLRKRIYRKYEGRRGV